jgi:hypothetical protein
VQITPPLAAKEVFGRVIYFFEIWAMPKSQKNKSLVYLLVLRPAGRDDLRVKNYRSID